MIGSSVSNHRIWSSNIQSWCTHLFAFQCDQWALWRKVLPDLRIVWKSWKTYKDITKHIGPDPSTKGVVVVSACCYGIQLFNIKSKTLDNCVTLTTYCMMTFQCGATSLKKMFSNIFHQSPLFYFSVIPQNGFSPSWGRMPFKDE